MRPATFVVAWLAWLALGTLVGRGLEGRAPWTGGLALAALLLGVDAALIRTIHALVPVAPATGALRVIAAVLAIELALYAVHRAMHATPALWRWHRLHHAPTPLRWHRAWQLHPIDAALFALTIAGATWLVGGTVFAATVVVARRLWTVVLHAARPWRRSAADRWLATPAFHHRHHDEAAPAANFASTLAVLDRLFGTWAPATDRPRRPTPAAAPRARPAR